MNQDLRGFLNEPRQISVCPFCGYQYNPIDFMIKQKNVGLVTCINCNKKITNLHPVNRW